MEKILATDEHGQRRTVRKREEIFATDEHGLTRTVRKKEKMNRRERRLHRLKKSRFCFRLSSVQISVIRGEFFFVFYPRSSVFVRG